MFSKFSPLALNFIYNINVNNKSICKKIEISPGS